MLSMQENQPVIFPLHSHKGFGRISKYAMSDRNLTPEAKAIYAYWCSYSNANGESYPSVYTITKELNISEKRYYKHIKLLLEQKYVSIEKRKIKNKFYHNVYIVEKLPGKYLDEPVNEKEKEIYDKVIMYGIQNTGYGKIVKNVMIDKQLSIKAKCIYAYFCSYAGNTDKMIAPQETILFHLNINKGTYYKHYRQLKQLGYITTYSERKGKNNKTIYVLHDPCHTGKENHVNDSIKNDSIKNDSIKNDSIKNDRTNINVPNNNNTTNNFNNHQSDNFSCSGISTAAKPKSNNDSIDFFNKKEKKNEIKNEKDAVVINDIISNVGIPRYYAKNKNLLRIAVRLLAGNQNFMASQREHSIVLDCITEMAAANPSTSKFGNMLDIFNKFININTYDRSASFSWLADFERQYSRLLCNYNVLNIKGYTKTSIANFLNELSSSSFHSDDDTDSHSSFDIHEFFNKAVLLSELEFEQSQREKQMAEQMNECNYDYYSDDFDAD